MVVNNGDFAQRRIVYVAWNFASHTIELNESRVAEPCISCVKISTPKTATPRRYCHFSLAFSLMCDKYHTMHVEMTLIVIALFRARTFCSDQCTANHVQNDNLSSVIFLKQSCFLCFYCFPDSSLM